MIIFGHIKTENYYHFYFGIKYIFRIEIEKNRKPVLTTRFFKI